MRWGVLFLALVTTVADVRANDESAEKAREAIRVCASVDPDKTSQTAAIEMLDRVVVMAEGAVAADEADAQAHLALFCGIGRRLEIAGLSWRSFGELKRARAAIDRASTIDPEHPDVLVARGEFISQLPRPLGGNPALGEKLLARALEIAPQHVAARLYLAKCIAARGAPEARAQVYEAIAAAKKAGMVREQAAAERLLASLDD